MNILALEFSSDARSVALVRAVADAGSAGGVSVLAQAEEREGRSTRALALVERVLREGSVARGEVDCLAIGLGPGSYTGIRTAIALAQGWSLAVPLRLVGVGSVDAMAWRASASGWTGRVGFAIDAQRGEYYFARFDLEDGGVRCLDPLRIVGRAEVEAFAAAGLLAGPGLERTIPGARGLCPDAAAVGALAASRSEATAGERLEPIYLRETSFVKVTPRPAPLP